MQPAQPLPKAMKRYSLEELSNTTPSRKDGVDAATEDKARRTVYNFIKKMCEELKLQSWTIETATIFTHRFFAERSITKSDRYLVAAGSVFLACKVDESPRALRDVAYVMYQTKNSKKPAELERLRSPVTSDAVLKEPMEHLLLAERAVLYSLAFDLNVDHPYTHVGRAIKALGIDHQAKPCKDFFQQTVNILNDSLATTLCLQYEAATLAHAVMYQVLSLSTFKLPIPENQGFLEYFSITQAELDVIIPQVMALYDKKPKAAAAQAAAGDAPVPSALVPQPRAGPPLPSFRPIIIPSDAPPVRPLASSGARVADVEEGELPSSTRALPDGAAGRAGLGAAGAASASAAQQNGPASEPSAAGKHASASAAAPDSDAEDGIHHAPGSGDQNNHNEPDAIADGLQAPQKCEQQQVSRKRTRSPGALEEGEIGFVRCAKSPCVSSV